jgi:peptidase E
MAHRLFGFFSGFPDHRFPEAIGRRLREELLRRDSLVFVSAWPDDYARNDSDSDGMHGMFEEYGMPFARHRVIDNRTEAAAAQKLIREASCIFLMGGHPGMQLRLIRATGIDAAIREAASPVLGVSAGAINMARRSLDTKESPIPYTGLGLADITVKPHFSLDNQQVLSTLLRISMELPICALEDESAIFASSDRISYAGQIHWVKDGKIRPISKGDLPVKA